MNVFSLLQLEWKRFFPNATFRVIIVLYAVFFTLLWVLAHLIGTNFTFSSNGQSYNPTRELFLYPNNWELLAFLGSWLNSSLMGFLGVFMITLEFSHKTLRQSIIFGLTRRDLFVAKTGSALAVAGFATGCYLVLGCFGGQQGGAVGATELALTPAGCALRFFLQSLGYFLLGTLFGLVIRQTALATLAYLAYAFFLESLGRWLFYFVISKTRALLFLPDSILEKLAPFPVPESVHAMVGPNAFGVPLTSSEVIVAALLYLVFFAFFLQRKLFRSDL